MAIGTDWMEDVVDIHLAGSSQSLSNGKAATLDGPTRNCVDAEIVIGGIH